MELQFPLGQWMSLRTLFVQGIPVLKWKSDQGGSVLHGIHVCGSQSTAEQEVLEAAFMNSIEHTGSVIRLPHTSISALEFPHEEGCPRQLHQVVNSAAMSYVFSARNVDLARLFRLAWICSLT